MRERTRRMARRRGRAVQGAPVSEVRPPMIAQGKARPHMAATRGSRTLRRVDWLQDGGAISSHPTDDMTPAPSAIADTASAITTAAPATPKGSVAGPVPTVFQRHRLQACFRPRSPATCTPAPSLCRVRVRGPAADMPSSVIRAPFSKPSRRASHRARRRGPLRRPSTAKPGRAGVEQSDTAARPRIGGHLGRAVVQGATCVPCPRRLFAACVHSCR